MSEAGLPRMYTDLAGWFHLLTAPADYAEEAARYMALLRGACEGEVATLLELGSGGGNNASHYKSGVKATLVDLSPGMLELSRGLNPECEHLEDDMRSVRLGRAFDAVFVHDAVSYLTTEADLAACMETAFVHLRPGGAALFAPDDVRETFADSTDHGGHDGAGGRGLRYLEWTFDPDPSDTLVTIDYAYLLREGEEVEVARDRHVCGLFARATWVQLLEAAGFGGVEVHRMEWDDEPVTEAFVARRVV
ncbi:MAG: class I SAM-dependent methyltransferase [Tepidiformaceae bacterium]